jgi:hypothetical protein
VSLEPKPRVRGKCAWRRLSPGAGEGGGPRPISGEGRWSSAPKSIQMGAEEDRKVVGALGTVGSSQEATKWVRSSVGGFLLIQREKGKRSEG